MSFRIPFRNRDLIAFSWQHWFREEGEISSRHCQRVFWLHWEAVRILGLDFMWVLNKVLALSRIFNHLPIPWVCRQHWYFVSPCRLVVRLVVAGAGCILPSVKASFSFLMAGWYLPGSFPRKICAAANSDLLLCWYSVVSSGAGNNFFTDFLHSE